MDKVLEIRSCHATGCTLLVLEGTHGGCVFVHSAFQRGNSFNVPTLRIMETVTW